MMLFVGFGYILLYAFIVSNIIFYIQGLVSYIVIKLTGKRIHYIEFHEESWFPVFIRRHAMIHLKGGWEMYGINKYIGGITPAQTLGKIMYDKIIKHYNDKETTILLDMMSGASGPTYLLHDYVYKKLTKNIHSFVSDLTPQNKVWSNLVKLTKNFGYVPISLDATQVNKGLSIDNETIKSVLNNNSEFALLLDYKQSDKSNKVLWIRSIFGSWHHLNEKQCIQVLYDAIKNNSAIIVAEKMLVRNTWTNIWKWPIINITAFPIQFLYNMYYIIFEDFEELTLLKFIKVLLIQPIIWFVKCHDMITSANRSYTKQEMFNMANKAYNLYKNECIKSNIKYNEYNWEYFMQPTLMPKPFCNIVKQTIFIGKPC